MEIVLKVKVRNPIAILKKRKASLRDYELSKLERLWFPASSY